MLLIVALWCYCGGVDALVILVKGCAKNTVDGEVLLRDLSQSGFEVTSDHEDADAIEINTCGFVEDAKGESIEAILEAANLKQVRIGNTLPLIRV